MDKIRLIAKNVLLELKSKKLEATPHNYFEEFMKQSKKEDFDGFEELNKNNDLKKFIFNNY